MGSKCMHAGRDSLNDFSAIFEYVLESGGLALQSNRQAIAVQGMFLAMDGSAQQLQARRHAVSAPFGCGRELLSLHGMLPMQGRVRACRAHECRASESLHGMAWHGMRGGSERWHAARHVLHSARCS